MFAEGGDHLYGPNGVVLAGHLDDMRTVEVERTFEPVECGLHEAPGPPTGGRPLDQVELTVLVGQFLKLGPYLPAGVRIQVDQYLAR